MKKIFALLVAVAFVFTACGRLSDPDNIWNVQREREPARAGGTITGLTPGVFAGVGTGGFYGDVSVNVTIGADGVIEAIEVTDHIDTPAFANRAFNENIPAMVNAGTYEVDTVAGATATSRALINAVENAVQQAR